VLGRVVEVASGIPLDEFFRTRIFEPLGMHETWFRVPDEQRHRCAELWIANPSGGVPVLAPPTFSTPDGMPFLSGGGGLWGTASDYLKFCHLLLGRGALKQSDGPPVRLLGSRTVEYMTRNHLPGGVDLESFGRPLFAETTYDGVGFGLGFAVVLDAAHNRVLRSPGEFAWGGAASTAFWVDPAEDLTVLFFTQLLPSSTYSIRPQLHQLVHQALMD
jgi:CubicO group peptidase (beta-lactamase class C family)